MAARSKSNTKPKRPSVEVIGLVHPTGAGGGQGGKETTWTMRFSFVLWRQTGGTVDERELYVSKPGLSDAKLTDLMSAIEADEIYRVRLRFPARLRRRDYIQAELVRMIGKDTSDTELTAKAEERRKPVTIRHPYFGTLTLDRRLNCYVADVQWNSENVRLALSLDDGADELALLATAHELFKRQKTWDKRVRDFAVSELLELKNGTWLGEDEKEFTPTTFKARIRLETIDVCADGSFQFWFNDGNLFWGHVIQVSGGMEEGPTDANIAG